MPIGAYTVCLDFDGTLADPGPPITWRPRARAFVDAALAAGVRLVIFSCRLTSPGWLPEGPGDAEEFYRSGCAPAPVVESWRWRDGIVDFLAVQGLLGRVELWDQPGKPMAGIYVDDRAALPDFGSLAAELGLSLADAERGRSSQVGPPGQRQAASV